MSTDGFGSGVSLPSAERSNCMNTRFQISIQRSPSASGGARRAARNVRAMVVEDFGARTAGAGVAHLPEVVGAAARLVADAHDLVFRHAGFLVPEVEGFIVGGVHRDHEARRIDLQRAGDEVPGEADGVLLEVVAEREVAQHLEEGVVAGGVAHVLEVVVFAARAHAALAGGGAHVVALVTAEEAVLELHHAGVGEEQRRVVARHEAGGRRPRCGRARGKIRGRRDGHPPRS